MSWQMKKHVRKHIVLFCIICSQKLGVAMKDGGESNALLLIQRIWPAILDSWPLMCVASWG